MILWLSVIGVAIVVAGAATWMVRRSIDRANRGPRPIDRSDSTADQLGL